ncbi:NAD-dependent epimerase/dehydratase family protein [Bacillus testis]|uniref:NAD-dependent epimerase/dehydratase family protein n=1 Tax=Bacillus testis TaxID=1622072 RepID=UPI00067E8C48|nr:NAD-dependent epimerase/dehydratase family protein [Bacillus testis]
MKTVEELEDLLSRPSDRLIEDIAKIDGDLMILGIGGKMGPTLGKMAKRAIEEANLQKRVIGVSRFSDESVRNDLEASGIETIRADLLNDEELKQLPKVKNLIYMAGKKFGTQNNEHLTWAMNTYLPGRVADIFKQSRIVVFSSGNVYPLTSLGKGECTEEYQVNPIGEYAQSCLGRERVMTYFSKLNHTPVLFFRLNYAIDLRYGVLLEIAKKVYTGQAIDLEMGAVNFIWQGDANEYAIRSLLHCSSPPKVLNITGPEKISVRWLANEFGKRFKKEVHFHSEEETTALLNNASQSHQLFGYPRVPLMDMIDWTAEWVSQDGSVYEKPTHFQERQGAF